MKQPTENSKKYPYLEQLSTQELEDLLQKDFISSEDNDDSTELILAIMEVIHAREAQQSPPIDDDTAWETFLARNTKVKTTPTPATHNQHSKTTSRTSHHRLITVTAVICVLVCLSLVPVQGHSVLRTFVDWTVSTFSFQPQEETNTPTQTLPSEADPSFSTREEFPDDEAYQEAVYQQIEKAVASLTDRPVLPTWYPEGSQVIRVEENHLDNGYYLVLVFSLNGNEFSVAVTVYDSEKEMDIRNYEKNEGSPEEYPAHGILHYIMGNMERNLAVWRNGPVECSIQGFLTVEQIKQMIDSIYA